MAQRGSPGIVWHWLALVALVVIGGLHVGYFDRRLVKAAKEELAASGSVALAAKVSRVATQARAKVLTYLGLAVSLAIVLLLAWP